jgi:hypothetical protein
VIGLVVGQVDAEKVESVVNGFGEAELLYQSMDDTDAAVVDAVNAVGGFIVDVGGGEQGSATAAEVRFVKSSLDATLAVFQPPM